MKTAVFIVLKVIALTIILFICFGAAGSVLGFQGGSQSPEEAGSAATALLAVCLLNTIVLTYIILRSRWTGWRLLATISFVYYGVTTFMSQIESAVFITRLPPGMLPRLFLMGALIAVPFSALAVLILGKRKAKTVDTESNERLITPVREWSWKLAVIAIAYLILYFTFGYYIAWRNPAVPEYYGGTDPGSFFAQMSTVLRDTPWLVPFQILRAMLWTLIALPVVRMMKGSWFETALAVALLFSVVMNSQLLLPNPYMPDAVRMAHLLETASSNFIFGFLIGWLLSKRYG
jgi:hypothetical protein